MPVFMYWSAALHPYLQVDGRVYGLQDHLPKRSVRDTRRTSKAKRRQKRH
jgi:hypothetical protein